MNSLADGLLRLGVPDGPLAATCRFSTMIRGVEWIPVRRSLWTHLDYLTSSGAFERQRERAINGSMQGVASAP